MKSVLLICISLQLIQIVRSKPQIGNPSKINRRTTYHDSYSVLAQAIQSRLSDDSYEVDVIASALKSLSKAQATLKKIDGTAHEVYQRTHKSRTNLAEENDESSKLGSLKVAGRMSRKAKRLGCIADALFTAELCELLLLDDGVDMNIREGRNDEEGTLAPWTERKIVYRTTISSDSSKANNDPNYPTICIMVVYEPGYTGGVGIGHGGVDELLRFSKNDLIDGEDETTATNTTIDKKRRGRYLVILSDSITSTSTASVDDLSSSLSVLDSPPCQVKLHNGSNPNERASVCEPLYNLAGRVVEAIEPIISEKKYDRGEDSDSGSEQYEHAIHIVGHSLAGGVAALTALILDGAITSPVVKKSSQSDEEDETTTQSKQVGIPQGLSSAFCLGPPPCISSNVQAPFITSIIHGDDIICRTSQATLQHLYERTQSSIKGGILGRSVGWMTDAVSLTVSGLTTSKSSKKQEKLVVPGNAFLIRPRRIGGGSSSIHEIGDGTASVRESLRASVLWQLNDILLSGSMLSHHGLNSYIRSLDKVKLSGLADDSSVEE